MPKAGNKRYKKDIKRHKRSNSVPRKLQKALRDVDRIDRGSKNGSGTEKTGKKVRSYDSDHGDHGTGSGKTE